METKENIDFRDLNTISNFLEKFTLYQTPYEIEKNINKFLKKARTQINETSKNLLLNGIKIEKSNKYEKIFCKRSPKSN